MTKKIFLGCLWVLAVAILLAGCKRHGKAAGQKSSGYFQTDFQDESQFIVEAIVSDLAEQIYYAKFHRLPEADVFSVSVAETAGSQFGAPVYEVHVDLDGKHLDLKTNINVSGPIWSPEVYEPAATLLANSVKLAASPTQSAEDMGLLAKLTDGEAATIEAENQEVSAALQNDFTNPKLHEEAALVLGAFMLREHAGDFFEIRSPLCRMTAHLALARHLEDDELTGTNAGMAEAMILTLMNNQQAALEKLHVIQTNNEALTSWVRALQARNTADYRPLDKLAGRSPIESLEWFYALDRSANTDLAWSRLSEVQKKSVGFIRIADEGAYSVGMGHELLAVALPLEFKELGKVYELTHHKKLSKKDLVPALNEMPDHCLYEDSNHQPGVHVIGWGLWAGFLQRQLCHAVENDFNFLQRKWGVPDDAKDFSTKSDELLGGLRLYPFVRRFNCVDVESYHKSVDDGFKVTVATPQLVAPKCWNYLCYGFSSSEYYRPNPNPHVNEWHQHNPPPGTAYDLEPRLDHPSLVNRADAAMWLDKLHDRAPYDWDLIRYILKNRFKNEPTYPQASQLFGLLTGYHTGAMNGMASTVRNEPDRYEVLMTKAAELDPDDYFTLAEYFAGKKQDDKAATYFEKGGKENPDAVMVANHAVWLVRYYLKKGQTEEARRVADFAGEVYSYSGLMAKAEFLEATKDYAGAFQWYANIEERYENAGPLVNFCLRYKAVTGDTRYDSEVRKRSNKFFPQGTQTVGLGDFSSAPTDGVLFQEESDLTRAAGLRAGDVVVAINHVRVHTVAQYEYTRDNSIGPEIDLIACQKDGYHEIKASPPDHLFGVDIGDFKAK